MVNHVKSVFGIAFIEDVSPQWQRSFYKEIEKMSSYYKLSFEGRVIADSVRFKFSTSEEEKDSLIKNSFSEYSSGHVQIVEILLMEFYVDVQHLNKEYLYIDALISKRAVDLAVALTIAGIGNVTFLTRVPVFIDNKHHKTIDPILHDMIHAFERAKQLKWPRLRRISLQKAIHWLEAFQLEMDKVSKTKVGRALNAFSHLFSRGFNNASSSDLFWCLMGLEALYTTGKEGLLGQLNINTELFLGKRVDFKKSFKELYNFRSRYVHGDWDIVNPHMFSDIDESMVESIDNVYDYEKFATAILIATFQKLVLNNWSEMEFKSSLKVLGKKIN